MSERKQIEGWYLRSNFAICSSKDVNSFTTPHQSYDFETRMYFAAADNGRFISYPFNALDREAVDRARRILLELGGTDPHPVEEKPKMKTLRPL